MSGPLPAALVPGVLAAIDAHAIVSVTDAAGAIVHVNAKFCEISGYAAEELLGADHRKLKSGAHGPAFYEAMWATLSRGQVWRGEICNRRKTGEPYWVEATIVPELDAQGEPCRYVSIRTDITTAKQAQLQALAAEDRYRRAQNFANLGTWDLDLRSNALYWSERIGPLFGYPPGQLATSYDNFLAAVHPADRDGLIAAVNHCIEHGTSYEYTHRCIWPDGTVHWLLERGDVTRGADGTPLHMLGIVQDVTARKEAQRQLALFRHVVESIDEGVALFRADSGIVDYVNPTGAKITGWPGPLVEGKAVQTLLPEAAGAGLPETMRRATRGEAVHTNMTFTRPDGTRVPLRNTITAVKDENGIVTHLVNAFGDRSPEIERQQVLQRALDTATQANHAKAEFMSRMSHELRTPLNAILGFSQLLLMRNTLDAQQADNVREVLSAGHLLLALIDDVLDIARIDLGAFKVALAPVALAPLLADSVALVAPAARERGITIEQAIDPAQAVVADALRLKQCLVNLLSNAVKYNRAGGIVRIRTRAQGGTRLRIEVHDDGVGIAAADLSRLFTPFTRLDRHSDTTEGIGIGLSITQRLVQLMGGQIGVNSQEGQGSVFWIELDAAALGTTGSAGVGQPVGQPGALPQGLGKRVLYIEDNPANLKLVSAMLGLLPGLQVLCAATADEGMAAALAHRPDLILLDITLPGSSGFEVLHWLRAQPQLAATPVIAVSANAMPADVQAGQAAGFDDYLTKPLDMQLLLQRVREMLARVTPP